MWCLPKSWTRIAARFFCALGLISAAAACGANESTTAASPAPTTPAVSTTSAPLATSPPIEVAEAWLAAYQLGDVEQFQALTHPDATALCLECGYVRQEAPYFQPIGEATSDASDSRMLALANGSLDPACAADGPVVTCETLRNSDFGFFADDGKPIEQMEAAFEFTVEDGLVVRRVLTIHSGQVFNRSAVADYRTWLGENYPEVEEELFAFSTMLLNTTEHFERHRPYVQEYLEQR